MAFTCWKDIDDPEKNDNVYSNEYLRRQRALVSFENMRDLFLLSNMDSEIEENLNCLLLKLIVLKTLRKFNKLSGNTHLFGLN